MKFKFLNKTIENRRFEYSPLYYNERKERLEKKKRLYEKMEGGDLTSEDRREMLRNSIREGWSRTDHRQKLNRKSNIRILILIVLLVTLGYFILNGLDDVENVVKKLW